MIQYVHFFTLIIIAIHTHTSHTLQVLVKKRSTGSVTGKRRIGKPYFQYIGTIIEKVGKGDYWYIKWGKLHPGTEREGDRCHHAYG